MEQEMKGKSTQEKEKEKEKRFERQTFVRTLSAHFVEEKKYFLTGV